MELALCAVFVTAGVLAIVGLTADDATGLGVADDSFLIPVMKFVTDKINAICEIWNSFSLTPDWNTIFQMLESLLPQINKGCSM